MKLTNENYVIEAKNAIEFLKKEKENDRKKNLVTTTKIRGLLSMLSDIYNEIQTNPTNELSTEVRSRINYLKVRFLYEAGRERTVKEFVQVANILNHIEAIKGDKNEFILFYHYMEALIAYFKYYNLDKE